MFTDQQLAEYNQKRTETEKVRSDWEENKRQLLANTRLSVEKWQSIQDAVITAERAVANQEAVVRTMGQFIERKAHEAANA